MKLKKFLFENQTVRQTVAKNTFWLGVGQIVSRLMKAALLIYVARVLGATGYGVFSYALGVAALFISFSDIGVNVVLTRELARNPDQLRRYLSASAFIKLAVLAFTILLILFAIPRVTKIAAVIPLLPLVALYIIFESVREFIYAVTRGQEKMEIEAGTGLLTAFAIVGLGFFVIFAKPSTTLLLWSYVAGSAIGLGAAFFAIRHHLATLWHSFERALVPKILREAWPLTILGLVGSVLFNIDTIVLGWLKTATEVGFYAAALRPVQLFYVLPSILTTSFFPVFSKLAGKDDSRFRSVFEKALIASLLFALPLVTGGIILAKEVLVFLFGTPYLPSVPAFRLLILTLITFFPASLIGAAFIASNRQRSLIMYTTLAAITNVGLNFLLVPRYSIVGTAIAVVLAQFLNNALPYLKMKRILHFRLLPYIGKISIATVSMALLVLGLNLLHFHVLFIIALAVAVYFGLLYLLKEPFLVTARSLFHE